MNEKCEKNIMFIKRQIEERRMEMEELIKFKEVNKIDMVTSLKGNE